MTRLTGTTPHEVLLSIKRRLIDVVADGTDSSVYLSSTPEELPPNSSDFMYEISFSGGQMLDAEMAGGGVNTIHVVGEVVVTVHSTVQIDEAGRDDIYLAGEDLGIITRLTQVLRALAIDDLENEAGEQICAQPMRPIDTQVPSHTNRRRGFASVGFSVEFDWDIGARAAEGTGTRLLATTPDLILNLIQNRIVNCVPRANNSSVYLSTVPNILPPNAGDFIYELYLSRGIFDQGEMAGGGIHTLLFQGDVHVTIHSFNQLDETGRDEIFLTDNARGVLPRATEVLNALAIHDLEDSAGNRVLAQPMRPTSFVIPPKEDRRNGFMQLTFSITFDWDMAPMLTPEVTGANELYLFDAGDSPGDRDFLLLEDGVNELQTE